MSEPASRASWKTLDPSEPLHPVDYTDTFTAAELAEIKRGLVPREMEDRWFIFFEPPVLYLHRSWTGLLVFKVELSELEKGARVSRAEVVGSNQGLARLLPWLIRGLLLRQD